MTTVDRPDVAEILAEAGLPSRLTAFVGGGWSSEGDGQLVDVLDPATGAVIARYEETSTSQMNDAVVDAHGAASRWAQLDPAERGRILMRVAHGLLDRADILARIESIDTGKPISQARADVMVSARFFEYYAGMADKIQGLTIPQPAGTFAYTVREPYGVVAHITPWNSPLSQMARGVAPCLAAGNVVVVKPSELTPLTTLMTGEIMADAGVPSGVYGVVLGTGQDVGARLTRHPLVEHITFTGSVAAGREVGAVAADRVIGCNLELGGKSPTIVCADADLDAAARAGAAAVVRNSGQACFATTRLLVAREVHDLFVEKVVALMDGLSVGHGLTDPDLGPLISTVQRDRVLGMVESARRDGAAVVVGSADLQGEGNFVAPVLLSGVTNDMEVARQEVFGPVQSVLAFDTLDEAIAIANDTPYGLSAGIFTSQIGVAFRAAAALKAGQVQVNRYAGAGVEIPFGGYKNSGIGREKGTEAIAHYTQVKSVIVSTA